MNHNETVELVNFIAMLVGYLMLGPLTFAIAWALGLWIEGIWSVFKYRRRRRQDERNIREREWRERMRQRREQELAELRAERDRMHDTVRLDETLEQEIYTYLEGNKS